MSFPSGDQSPRKSGVQVADLAGAGLIKARPWDVIGAALAAPMLIWGLLGWFGTVGDNGNGVPGFYSGNGAAGISMVLAASALIVNQILQGRPHVRDAPPVAVLLAGAASLVVLGGMLAKPESTTIQAGSVAGLFTAISQAVCLTVGWLQGSEKLVKAANVAARQAEQAQADAFAAQQAAMTYPPPGHQPQGFPPQNIASAGYPGQQTFQTPPNSPGRPGYGGQLGFPAQQVFPGQQGFPGSQAYPAPDPSGYPPTRYPPGD